MPSRRDQIIQLLGSRFDFDWHPAGSLRTTSGLAPGQKRPCPACAHTDTPGWLVDAFKRRTPCLTCGGRLADPEAGVRAKRGKGFVHIDSMDAHRQPVGSGESRPPAKPQRTVLCDACAGEGATAQGRCPRCDGDGRRPLHVFNLAVDTRDETTDLDALTASIARRDQLGSYHELDLALARIIHTVNKPPRFLALTLNSGQALRLLDDLYLPPAARDEAGLSLFERSLVELALAYVDEQMPAVIRVPTDVRLNERVRGHHLATAARGRLPEAGVVARKNRDRQIREWAREGKPYPWICQQVGLSDRQLREIINRPVKREAAA